MRDLGRVGRALRRLQRLGDHLPAEHAADAAGLALPTIQVGVDLLDVEQLGEAGSERLGWRVEGGVEVHAPQYPAARASRSAWKLASPNSSARTRARFM